MNMKKQWRRELRKLQAQRESTRKAFDKQLWRLRRQFTKDLKKLNQLDDRNITRINRRMAILEGRLS